mgnify:CR=1 FL=1
MAVLLYAENKSGSFKKPVFEAAHFASDAAQKLGTELVALTIGDIEDAEIEKLGTIGVQRVIRVSRSDLQDFEPQSYASILAQVAKQEEAELVTFASTFSGKSYGARTAAKLDAGLATGATSLATVADDGLIIRKPVFSSKGFAYVKVTGDIKMISVEPNAIGFEEYPVQVTIEDRDIAPEDQGFAYQVQEQEKEEGKVPLTESEKVVSAGRGMKGPDNWHLIEDLADAIGASTACSKPVSDMEWRPHSEHVGQTGTTIRPNLYIAVGISGAIQHQAGVSNSKIIVAINKDPEAPIFKIADYGIVGDAFDILPRLTKAAKEAASTEA